MKQKKIQKKKEREERLRIQRHTAFNRNLYPDFIFLNEKVCTSGYLSAVKSMAAKIDFQKLKFPEENNDIYHKFLRNVKKYGYKYAFSEASGSSLFMRKIVNMGKKSADEYLASSADDVLLFHKNTKEFSKKNNDLLSCIGNNIIMSSENINFLKYYPEQGFRICFLRDKICFLFQRIYNKIINYNIFYHYMMPTFVWFRGEKLEILFTKHAIDRIVQRFSKNGVNDYFCYTSLYQFFNNMKCKIKFSSDRSPYIQFYFPLIKGLEKRVTDIIGKDEKCYTIEGNEFNKEKGYQVYVKCFASPIVLEKDKVSVITALLPGYQGTPEFEIINKKGIANMKLRDRVRHMYFNEVDWCSENYAEALQFFHETGERQIFFDKPIPCWNPFNLKNYYEFERQISDLIV